MIQHLVDRGSVVMLVVLLSFSARAKPAETSLRSTARGRGPRYRDASLPVEERVDDLLRQMTLAEKIGQMTQAEQQTASPSQAAEFMLGGMLSGGDSAPTPNTVEAWVRLVDEYQSAAKRTRLGIPILYGVDAVHGRQLVSGATVFPHLLGLAATGDAGLVRQVGGVTAREMAATGVYWTFSPMVAVSQDERWGRTYESFGEDVHTVSTLGAAYVEGMMAALGPGLPAILPTAKHFIGDGATVYGSSETRNFQLDEGDTRGDTERLLAKLLPPYQALLRAGTRCVMASYNRWNGLRMHANRGLIEGTLKGQLGFKGFVVSDWEGFRVLDGKRHEQIVSEVNAGVDMTMAPLRGHVTNLIVVLVAGRPLVLGADLAQIDALAMAWLPGVEGEGVSDALFGDRPFAGRLPIGWPKTVDGYQRADADPAARCASLQWSRGFGLGPRGGPLGPEACPAEAPAGLVASRTLSRRGAAVRAPAHRAR